MQYTYFIIQEQDTFGLFSFSDDAVEEWSTLGRCYDVMSHGTLKDWLLIFFYFDQLTKYRFLR